MVIAHSGGVRKIDWEGMDVWQFSGKIEISYIMIEVYVIIKMYLFVKSAQQC